MTEAWKVVNGKWSLVKSSNDGYLRTITSMDRIQKWYSHNFLGSNVFIWVPVRGDGLWYGQYMVKKYGEIPND